MMTDCRCDASSGCVVKIQSWYRMLAPLQAHKARKRAQRRTRQIFFRALRLHWKSERLFRVSDQCSYRCTFVDIALLSLMFGFWYAFTSWNPSILDGICVLHLQWFSSHVPLLVH
jgi:hypothetical protein